MNAYFKERQVAIDAIREAATVTAAVQASIAPQVLEKADKSPVTVADFASQALICRQLQHAFPDDPIIGEEDSKELGQPSQANLLDAVTGWVARASHCDVDTHQVRAWIDRGGQHDYCQRFWTLDPIDGTRGFLRKDQYAISLALIDHGEIVVGALCCPRLVLPSGEGAIFVAVKGDGTRRMGLFGDHDEPVFVSRNRDLSHLRTCESVEKAHSSHSDSARIARQLGIEVPPVRIDSQAKYAVVAQGSAEVYLRLPRDSTYREKIWDHAGGVLVVQEAGGTVSDIHGKPLHFTKGTCLTENIGVVVTNGEHHDTIIAAIKDLQIGCFTT